MNEEVINDLYNNAVSKGYKKSREEFVSLLQSNDAVMNDMYSYVQSKGYKKGVDDFKGLIGATVESPMAVASKKKEDSVSPFVDGGSELTRFDPTSGQVVQETPAFTQPQPEVKVPEQKLPEMSEFGYQVGKPLPAQKTAPLPKFVEEQLSTVTPELIGKTEENVVPQLKYQFGPLGFKFEETRAGDYMMATSPSGESIYISLDITNPADREVEANKLNAFLRKGATTVKNLSTLQKQYVDANKKITSQKELDDSLASINAEETKIMARNADFVKLQDNLESERARLESVPPQQRNNPEYIARVNDFMSRADQFTNEFKSFVKDAEDLTKRGQQLNKSIGKYTEMKAEQGTWYGAALNAIANKSFYEMAKGFSGVAIDFIGEIIPTEALMSQDDYEKNFIEQARKEGIDVPEDQDFISLASNLDPETIARIENRVRDVAKKTVRGEVTGSLDKASKMAMESSGVSPDYYRSIEETFVGGALLGALTSIPAMAGGPVARTVLMGSQVLSGIDAEMDNDPEFADISQNERYLVKGPIATAVAILENLGLSNLLNQKGFLNNLVLKALGKVGVGASYKTFSEVIQNEISSAVGRGALTLGAGFLAEAETGALQEVADIGFKSIYNMAKEKEMFDTPDSVVQFIEQVGKAGLQEGIGAGVLAVPGSVSAAYTGKGFLGMDDAQFAMFEKMANDSNIEKGFIARLKSRINTGEITTAEGKDILNNYRNSVSLFNSLPENLDMQGKKEAMNLLKERRDLERQIDGKDQALTVPQRNRITQINEQLTKLSEDAIQEQAAGEVPVQSGATVSEEVAEGVPQAEPQVVTEEGQEKINDIERRRQEELSNYDEEGLNETYAVGSDQTVGEFINSKYDAELASLEQSAQQLDLDGEVSILEQLLAQEETAPTQAAGVSVSSETDVEDLRNRTQSRSQQATTQEEKESANTRVKIIDTAKKAINTLKSVFPNVDIVIHDDEGSYNAAMSEIDGVAGSRGNFFIDTTPDGKTTGRIDINLSKANSRTVAHEIAHGILLKTFGDNKNLFNDFRTRMSKVLKGDVNQQLNDFANQYVDPATGELLDVNHEEFLAELTGILEQQETNVSVTTMQKVAALINEFVSKITGGKFKPFQDTKNTKDVVDFFNTISGAIREGQGLEGVTEKINPNAEPTGTNVDTSSLKKRSSLIEKLGLERFSDMDKRITEGITLNSLGDIISHLTFSDRLVTGRVGNKDYLGGILFAAATNRVWASFTKGRVSQIISGMPKNEDGYRYLMPALLTEGAHMSNKDMSNTAIKLVEDAISNGDISPVDADSRIRKALNRKGLESFSKLYSDTIGKNKLTPELVISAIDNAIVKSNSTFEDRNTFLESLLGKADINLKKRFGTLPSYNVLANGLAEPITNRHEFGDILLVIRTKGDLIAVQPKEGDPDYHPSYPWVIRSVNPDGSIADVETLIFDQSYNAVNVFPEVTNKQGQKFTYQQYVDKYGDGAKSRYLGYMGARSAMSTSVTEKIATEAQPKSKVVSRSQLPGNDAQRIVNLGRANGLSEQAISTVLQKRGFTQEAIDAALGKAEPAAKKVEVTEEFAPGYDRVLNEIFGKDGVVAKSRRRGRSEEEAMQNAIDYLQQDTKVYENATDVQREAMVRNVRKEFKKREKAAPSAEKIVGKPKKKQVTVDEMAALKDQIKLEARAAREAKGALNDKREALAAKVSALKGKGTVTTNQIDTIVKRIESTNLDNPIMVDRLLAYIEKVFDNANYTADMAELRKLQRQARSRNHASMTNVVKQFTSINPENIPLDRIQEYKKALDFLNNLTPSYATMNEMLDEMLSYQISEEFDAIKTMSALEKKYEDIMSNEVKTVEDYVNLIKDINSFKRRAFQLLQNEEIIQEDYDKLIKMVGKDQQTIEEKYKDEITKIKKDLIDEIKNQRPKVSRDFSNAENDLIRKYLELSDADLKNLSPEDLFVLNDLLENISNGEIDVSRFGPIVSKAYTSSGLDPLAKQINKSKFDKSSEEGRQELSEQESSFWEGLLGMGRAKAGALQKLIISPFNRAIGSYEKFSRDGLNEFLKLKNKYKIDRFDLLKNSKDMHKIGMLTTYLQEYMAQFDSKNKDVKDIGKRDWFKEILNSRAMRDNYSSGKPSVFKSIGLGKSELDIIKEIWDSLPKDKDGNVDPKAVYDSYMANDGKFFTKNQKAFFDDVMAYKASEITPKQKFANELSGASFKEIPFHMMRVRLDKGKSQIAPSASSENNNVRITAGTGKERVSEKVGAVMTNFEKLFISGIEQTGRDYFLSNTLQDINNTLAGVKKILGDKKIELINTISYTLSDALKFEFDRTKSNFIFRNLLSARAAQTLLRPIRTAVELGSTLVSYPVRAKTLSGYKSLFGEQGAMKKLLEFTDSPMLLRDNISKAIDINDGSIEPQSRFTKATNYLSGLPERTMMVTSWMPTFKSEFKTITGTDFDMKKFNDSEAYREKYGKAIRESSAAADSQTEKIIGPTTKAGQRREVRIAPRFLANLVGSEGTVSKNTATGQILGFFSNYPFRESTEFLNGFREAAEVLNDEGALSSLSQLQKPLGVALNVAAYSFLSSATYALSLILLGDDDDEERGEDLLKALLTGEGLLEELKSNAISLAGSQYAAGGKALIQLAATILIESTDDEDLKAKYKKLLKDSVFIDPLPVDKAIGFKGEEEIAGAIGKYIPQFIVAHARYADLIGTKNELKEIYDKVERKGVAALTEDEGIKILALNTAFNSAQLVLNLFGTSLPEYNYIKTYMKKLKEEAGVADVYKGEAPAKKSSKRGAKPKQMNKADLKRYNRELYDQMYGPDSPGYEIEQEVKAFEKQQREIEREMKDRVFGVKD
jgi:hypothetical protein